MTNPAPQDQPSYWALRNLIEGLRADHESAYREQLRLAERLERIDTDVRAMLVIPVEVRNLTISMDRLSQRLEEITTATQTGTRWAWGQVITLIGIAISLAALAIVIGKGLH